MFPLCELEADEFEWYKCVAQQLSYCFLNGASSQEKTPGSEAMGEAYN